MSRAAIKNTAKAVVASSERAMNRLVTDEPAPRARQVAPNRQRSLPASGVFTANGTLSSSDFNERTQLRQYLKYVVPRTERDKLKGPEKKDFSVNYPVRLIRGTVFQLSIQLPPRDILR